MLFQQSSAGENKRVYRTLDRSTSYISSGSGHNTLKFVGKEFMSLCQTQCPKLLEDSSTNRHPDFKACTASEMLCRRSFSERLRQLVYPISLAWLEQH